MMPIKLDNSTKRGHRRGGFGIEILYPGLTLGQGDSGIAAIGRIDQARIGPGGFIAMHPHKDDEIFTYVRSGAMLHRDTAGHEEVVTNRRLMLMNAGHTFQHEERMLGHEDIEALQIFIRPREAALEPQVQFHDFDEVYSGDAWRLLAGPKGRAPLELRAEVLAYDVRLSAGAEIALPPPVSTGSVRLLYVFKGDARLSGFELTRGESLILDSGSQSVEAKIETDLVLFETDPFAPVFKGGMFSGNVSGRM
jgi:redox-sensitive bicupin YhaK (pirin superfamily)